MTPGEWDELAEQVMTRGVQKEAEQILKAKADAIVEVSHQDSRMIRIRRNNKR